MVQMALSNLGILLLMHLLVNSIYHLESWGKVSAKTREYIQLFITTGAIISLFYFPIEAHDFSFDLRIVPILYIAILKGWSFVGPMLFMISTWRFIQMGLVGSTMHEVIFTILLPAVLPQFFTIKDGYALKFYRVFLIVTLAFLGADFIHIYNFDTHTLDGLNSTLLFRYGITIVAALVYYFFIYTGAITRRLREQLKEHAEIDPLTRVYNIRKFNQVTSEKIKKDSQKKAFIAMLDIDNFKKINDNYGHPVGDYIISKVAQILTIFSSPDFIVGRYGGDEFIVFFQANSMDEAIEMFDDIKNKIAGENLAPLNINQAIQVSLSGGVCEYTTSQDLKTCMSAADKMLYLSKKNGRNQITG